MPIITVVLVGLVLEAIREIRKLNNDIKTNRIKAKIFKETKFVYTTWNKIKVGNILKISKDEYVPADLLVIKTSNKDGSYFLQTTNLDGETNLKPRDALNFTQSFFMNKNISKNLTNLKKIFCGNNYIEVEQPNKNIYQIDGKVLFNENEQIFFDIKNTAIRGSKLKNANYIYGIVLFTGKDTKIMQNVNKTINKVSKIDNTFNYIALFLLVFRLVYVIILMAVGIYTRKKYMPTYKIPEKKVYYEYLFYYRKGGSKNTVLENVKYFTSHFIVSQALFPTSILVFLAFIKIIQTLFIEFLEVNLRKEKNEEMKCLSSSLQSELGLVKYIFSDKTGTLTKNEMQFKACSIFTSLFDESDTSAKLTATTNFKTDFFSSTNNINFHSYKKTNKSLSTSHFSTNFDKENLLTRLKLKNIPLDIKNLKGCPFNSQGDALDEFLLNISLNHEITIENNNKDLNLNYQGPSPDEVTLVGAANELGYSFIGKEGNILKILHKNVIKENSEIKKYEILLKIPFSSERQCSTIIIRDLSTNLIKLYMKGSDTKIYEKINNYSIENILEITKSHVDDFARRGLRTLCYAFKIIPELEYEKFYNNYIDIKNKYIIDKSLKKDYDNLIEKIENDSYLLGATALEDTLQDEVKEDIQKFIEADINFWMITGDKMDTAESIGYSIKLFDADTEVYKIQGNKKEDIISKMENIKLKIKESQTELSKLTMDDEVKNSGEYKNDIRVDKLGKIIENNIEKIQEVDGESNFIENNDNILDTDDLKLNKSFDEENTITSSMEVGGDKPINCDYSFKHNVNYLPNILRSNNNDNNKNINNNQNIINNENNKNINNNNNHNNNNKNIDNNNNHNNRNINNNSNEKLLSEIKNSQNLKKKINQINAKNIASNLNNIINNVDTNNKSIKNMSILKFMIDNQYIINSNTDLEKMTFLKGKVVNPSITFSEKSNTNKNNIKPLKINSDNDNLLYKQPENVNEKSLSKSINNSEQIKNSKNNDDDIKTSTKDENGYNSNRKLIKRTNRLNLNLPTSSKQFLEYFNTCLLELKKYLQMEQNILPLFKIPYLFGEVDKEQNPLIENKKQIFFTENKTKNKFENYLLNTKVKYSLIIHGESLPSCISEGKASELFWYLIQHSRSIICCRCSPIQKSQIVKFVKKHTDKITLAIGDGENDVSMIKSANIGVGILGKEGLQTAYNSDYAFCQFKYLKTLLFINGRFSLLQNIYFIFCYFYKNVIFCLPGMMMTFFNLYSGTFFYDAFYESYFNTFVSVIPLFIYSITEIDFDPNFNNKKAREKKFMSYLLPSIYKQTRDMRPFNLIKFAVVVIIGVIFAIIIFFFNIYCFKNMITDNNGYNSTLFEVIFYVYVANVAIHFITVIIDTYFICKAFIIFFIIQIVIDVLFIIMYNSINASEELLSGILYHLWTLTNFLILIIVCAFVSVFTFILRRANYFFGMNLTDKIKQNKIEKIYIGKFYQKKVDQMIRATRAIAKFKKIHNDLAIDNINKNREKNKGNQYENLIDMNMKKIVEHYQKEKKIQK